MEQVQPVDGSIFSIDASFPVWVEVFSHDDPSVAVGSSPDLDCGFAVFYNSGRAIHRTIDLGQSDPCNRGGRIECW